jgi:predicted AAA+ superfamily ATPase
MERYLTKAVKETLGDKFILLMGPRQVGKTTLAKSIDPDGAYYNYDIRKDWKVFHEQDWDYSKKLIIFDELHKMKKWKLWLKGIYDSGLTKKQSFIVTGSAQLDVAKKMGDSLAGRFWSFRLNPLDLKELGPSAPLEESYRKLIKVSGFPEPFLKGDERFYNRWRRTHLDIILKQDLITTENIRDLEGIELLIELLAHRVGSTISYNSLSRELGRDDKTVKRWLDLLERLYVVFRVSPYSKNIARGIKKAEKYYFYDCARVQGDESRKLENLVALSLKKEIEFQEDYNGQRCGLYFLQLKDGYEIDFLVTQSGRPPRLIEVKLSEDQVSPQFKKFEKYFPQAERWQLVRYLSRSYQSKDDIRVTSALKFLRDLDFSA